MGDHDESCRHDDEQPPVDMYDDLIDASYSEPEPQWVPEAPESEPETERTRSVEHDLMSEIRTIIAAHHRRSYGELAEAVSQIASAEDIFKQLDENDQHSLKAVLEVLGDMATINVGGVVDLTYIPLSRLYDRSVQAEFDAIRVTAEAGTDINAGVAWQALRERVQREIALYSIGKYSKLLRAAAPVEELVDAYKNVASPTTRRAATRARSAATAADIAAAHRAANGSRPRLRIASGWPTVDLTFTARSGNKLAESLGFITPGEGFVVAGPTGTGKSSWTYGFVTSAVLDLINQGEVWSKVLFAHTEEESMDKIRAFGMLPGQSFHHAAENLLVANIGTSRLSLAMAIYDNVAEAAVRSKETGVPIDKFLIRMLVLDYIQAIVEPGENPTDATVMTAEFLLRGVQMWNPEEMAKWSGLSYRSYTGQPWPEGMDHHRVAGVYMAQLVKQDDSSLLYRPGDRKCQLSDFTLEASDPAAGWKGPDGNFYEWEVKEGDLRLFKQNSIRGSGVILQNATAIIILHRSRAYNNPAKPGVDADGRKHLEDIRGRMLLDKMRTGSNLKYVPMSFDLDAYGFRARYIDLAAEHRLAAGKLQVADSFERSGDPMLPARQRRTAFDDVVY